MRHSNPFLSLVSICIIASGCAAPTASEDKAGAEVAGDVQALHGANLLALGDSIAFGYSVRANFKQPKSMHGYPEVLEPQYSADNASCPGETSASIYNPTAADNGCRNYRAAYPLHVDYSGTQLDYALDVIATDTPDLITYNIGGNDIFLVQATCASDPNPAACFGQHAAGLIGSIAQNVATVLASIRGAGYQGPIVYMNLYSTNYNDPNTVAFLTALNSTVSNVARQFGAQIADAYTAFQTAAGSQTPCDAGLLVHLPSGGCDVHPSTPGAKVLAQSVRDAN